MPNPLRALREKAGLSLEEVATRLYRKRSYVQALEAPSAKPPCSLLAWRMVRLYDCDILTIYLRGELNPRPAATEPARRKRANKNNPIPSRNPTTAKAPSAPVR